MAGAPEYLDPSEAEVHYDQQMQKWVREEPDGTEWEWHGQAPEGDARTSAGRWLPVIGAKQISMQQEGYRVPGMDEHVPAAPVLDRVTKGRKRKAAPDSSAPRKPRPVTAVFVSQLPLDVQSEEIERVFSRYGVLLEDSEGRPRVKLYHDEKTGAFKGEALVVYFKPESVDLAIQLLDDTPLRSGPSDVENMHMRVERAEFREEPAGDGDAGTSAAARPALTEAERKNIRRRIDKMQTKVNDWDDSDDERAAQPERDTGPSTNACTLVLKKMFTLAELDEDPTLLLDLKQDVREECESLGEVTNVVLWDKEPEGVITVRFADPAAARACLKVGLTAQAARLTTENGRTLFCRAPNRCLPRGRPAQVPPLGAQRRRRGAACGCIWRMARGRWGAGRAAQVALYHIMH